MHMFLNFVYFFLFHIFYPAFCEYENSPDQCCSTYPKMPSHGENDLGNRVNKSIYFYLYRNI